MTFPFYAKLSLISIGSFSLAAMLYIGRGILVPILFAIIIAIILSPFIDFLVRKRMNRVLAISIALTIISFCGFTLMLFIGSRLTFFAETFPLVMDKFYVIIENTVNWLSHYFHIRTRVINSFIEDSKTELFSNGKKEIGATLSFMGNTLVSAVLIPVYVFMILFYQPLLLDFFRRVFGKSNEKDVNEILGSTKSIIQSYLIGLLLEALIIAALNTIGLLILDIRYAIVLGIIGALLNVIPYLGGLIAMSLFAIVALVTKDSSIYMLYVIILYSVIQFIDNNYIIPKLVGSKVKINALVAIVAAIAGGALWGVAGMFLSLPLIAITKLIFDRIEVLKPWGFLLGDTMPPIQIFKLKIKI
ncbi:MAG: AI-2E family transporter [Bacteroidetes bacterium]|nr:AI-2E family transporter [Bacteroidota bacterium]